MSILEHQRGRIAAALRSLLRAANGLDASPAVIRGRTQEYLSSPTPPNPAPGYPLPSVLPLFRASDYAPTAPTDPLGGKDGRDISRAWAAIREDFDTAQDVVAEIERRLARSLAVLQRAGGKLNLDLASLTSDAAALQNQLQQLFYGSPGGSSTDGRGSRAWSVTMTGLVYPETTGILISSGVGLLPTAGQAVNGNSTGGYLATFRLLSSSDPVLASGSLQAEFLEQPFGSSPSWTFGYAAGGYSSLTFQSDDTNAVGAFEVNASPGTSVQAVKVNGTAVPFQSLASGGTLWILPSSPISPGQPVELDFLGTAATPASTPGIPASTAVFSGSVSAVRGHVFSFDTLGSFVWGPYDASGLGDVFAVNLSNIQSARPQGSSLAFSVSTVSQDGPWVGIPSQGGSIALASSGREELDLPGTNFQPDAQTQGYYQFPFSQAGSLTGADFSAGTGQAKVESYRFNWLSVQDVAHQVSQSDWTAPQGSVNTVAMGAGPEFDGGATTQAFDTELYAAQGTCLSRYTDSNGADLAYIGLRGGAASGFLLQPGYNYRFSFSCYTSGASFLSGVPVGIYNPNGAAGVYGVPFLVELNGQQVYRSNTTFQSFAEVSEMPSSYGALAQNYTLGSGTWPPYCGRMNLALTPGWNTLRISVYIPDGEAGVDANLGAYAGIVFGPSVFMETAQLLSQTGIQIVRGWPEDWTQLSEFDLRSNTPIGLTEVWAWVVDPGTAAIQAVLINHNPNVSETGFPTLDGVFSGQPRTHHLSYLPQAVPSSAVPGQDPSSANLWVQAVLSSASPESGPILSGFQLAVN